MRAIGRVLAILCALVMLTAAIPAAADDNFNLERDGFSTSYTYNYDYWRDVQASPDAYRVAAVIDSVSLGLDNLDNVPIRRAQSLFVKGQDLYVCDTGNNRILQIRFSGDQYKVERIISSANGTAEDYEHAENYYSKSKAYESAISKTKDAEKALNALKDPSRETPATDAEIEAAEAALASAQEEEEIQHQEAMEAEEKAKEFNCRIWEYEAWKKNDEGSVITTFNTPNDIAVDNDGNIYVADMNNFRVLKMDKDCNVIWEFTKPLDATFDQSLSFMPSKLAVDVANRVYVLCLNVNKGFVKFEADGVFSGFIGANTVSVNMAQYIWKRYFQTKEQRAASESFVPTEYENMYMDPDGFIYATNTIFSEYDLLTDKAKPIRRLNSLGSDILIKNDRYPPVGDLWWIEESVQNGPSKFTDITVLDNDIYVAVDRTRGRLFGYDNQGVLLWAFGTKGNVDGAFTGAVSVEHIGNNLLVLDQLKNNITVFSPTEFGAMIYDAIESYTKGQYDESADLWGNVLKLNANYPLAFRGIGRAILRQNDFKGAMEYFEMAHDRENYGRAFKLYRKEWVEKNIWWIILLIAILLIVPLVLGRMKRMKWEVIMHEHSKVRK